MLFLDDDSLFQEEEFESGTASAISYLSERSHSDKRA